MSADNETYVNPPGSLAWHRERNEAIRARWMRHDTDPDLWKDLDTLTTMYDMHLSFCESIGQLKPNRTELLARIEELRAGLEVAIKCIHYLEDEQAMPDDGYLPMFAQAEAALDGQDKK